MNVAPTFLNFAYGSNMLTRRLRERVPSARPVVVAVLAGYELRWHKVSQDGSGKCDVVQVNAPQATVVGVIYEILASEKAQLDAAEGLGNGYAEKWVALKTEGGEVQAQTYYATNIKSSLVPYTWYKALVVAGAKEHGLPEEYVSAIEAIAAKADANASRAEKNFTIANAG
jgi:gamma-glutamylcyclotransferase